MKFNDRPQPTIFAIFGAAGDLTWRKVLPALYSLYVDKRLPEQFAIIGLDRIEWNKENFHQRIRDGIFKFTHKDEQWQEFSTHLDYLQGDFKAEDIYGKLKQIGENLSKQWNTQANYVFYMATAPSLFSEIPKHLKKVGLSENKEAARLVVEKPIGYDLESARGLNQSLAAHFDESQIFRIDHYLGKETVQNILAFRFANPFFEPIWNRRYIEYVSITVAEKVGVEHRGGYYEHAGALRDMVQNHLLQLLCLVAMEPMVSFTANEIRNKKVDVLHAIRPITHELVHEMAVRGQYGKGWIDGVAVPEYREEEGVAKNSFTETFVALKLFVDNWRWNGIPFYLRTGKRLRAHSTQIVIQFKGIPHQCFPPESTLGWHPSRLIISIQPLEGIILRFQAKMPGSKMHLRTVDMRFNYKEAFSVVSRDAYETLLWDVMKNDATLFMRSDQIEAAWKLLMPIIEMWEESPPSDFPNYQAGTWGPEAAQSLFALSGHTWPIPY